MSVIEANLADAAGTAYSISDGSAWKSMAPPPLAPDARASLSTQPGKTHGVKQLIWAEFGVKISYAKGNSVGTMNGDSGICNIAESIRRCFAEASGMAPVADLIGRNPLTIARG